MLLRELRSAEDPAEVGGKATGLAALVRGAIPVPPTWVLPASALDDHLARIGTARLAREVEEGPPGRHRAHAAALLRSAIFSGAIDDELSSSIQDALTFAGSLAIRSSATIEGLPGSSLAGQFQSFLGVRTREQALSAIRSCWASLWSPGALRSRAVHGGRPRMALVVQSFVPAEVAGTAEAGGEGVIVEAAWGLGPAVLGGLVVPDRWTFDGATPRFRPGSKSILVVAQDGGLQARPVPPDLRTVPCLNEARAAEVAALARSVAAVVGQPLLIEWASHRDAISVVQATARAHIRRAADADGAGLRGIPAAPGVAVGHVRAVGGAGDPSDGSGAVLVAHYIAAPAVATLRAAAIVTEMGGSSAHAVSIARERGVPMVTGVVGAARRLREGDLVRVDGTRGLVRRIS